MTSGGSESAAMRRAIVLSAFGLGSTSPNPPVGCVVLGRSGAVVGEGYHERKGEPHAEVHALSAAGARAVGGTAVVTLEPCNHTGRTPPCRQALIDARVTRVVVAVLDPTSRGEGGVAALRAAGVGVVTGVLADEALVVLGPWLAAHARERPLVTWAYGIDAAGRPVPVATVAGRDAERWRAGCDAVLSGDGLREGRADAHGRDAFRLPAVPRDAPPAKQLAALGAGGVRTVLVDGDRAFVTPFLVAGLVDRVLVAVAPTPASQRPINAEMVPAGFVISGVERGPDATTVSARSSGRS